MIDAVFDLDGTLVHSAVQCEAIIAQMRADRGFREPVSRVQCEIFAGRPGEVMVPALLADAARGDGDVHEFRERYAAMRTPEAALYDGVRKGLGKLAGDPRMRLSICSAKPQILCDRVLGDLGLAPFFEAVVGGDTAPACKPDARHLEETLRRVGGRSSDAVLIGDSITDHALARNCSVPFVFARYGYSKPGEVYDTKFVAENFDEVVEIVEQFANRARHAAKKG